MNSEAKNNVETSEKKKPEVDKKKELKDETASQTTAAKKDTVTTKSIKILKETEKLKETEELETKTIQDKPEQVTNLNTFKNKPQQNDLSPKKANVKAPSNAEKTKNTQNPAKDNIKEVDSKLTEKKCVVVLKNIDDAIKNEDNDVIVVSVTSEDIIEIDKMETTEEKPKENCNSSKETKSITSTPEKVEVPIKPFLPLSKINLDRRTLKNRTSFMKKMITSDTLNNFQKYSFIRELMYIWDNKLPDADLRKEILLKRFGHDARFVNSVKEDVDKQAKESGDNSTKKTVKKPVKKPTPPTTTTHTKPPVKKDFKTNTYDQNKTSYKPFQPNNYNPVPPSSTRSWQNSNVNTGTNLSSLLNISSLLNNAQQIVSLPAIQQQLSQVLVNNMLQTMVKPILNQDVNNQQNIVQQQVQQSVVQQPIVQQPGFQQPVVQQTQSMQQRPVPLLQKKIERPIQLPPTSRRQEPKKNKSRAYNPYSNVDRNNRKRDSSPLYTGRESPRQFQMTPPRQNTRQRSRSRSSEKDYYNNKPSNDYFFKQNFTNQNVTKQNFTNQNVTKQNFTNQNQNQKNISNYSNATALQGQKSSGYGNVPVRYDSQPNTSYQSFKASYTPLMNTSSSNNYSSSYSGNSNNSLTKPQYYEDRNSSSQLEYNRRQSPDYDSNRKRKGDNFVDVYNQERRKRMMQEMEDNRRFGPTSMSQFI